MKNRRREVVVPFSREGKKDSSKMVRGLKGLNLAEMSKIGAPIPPGFTITTTTARAYLEHSVLPKRAINQIKRSIIELERITGRVFGNAENPLLVSVRSGAAASMPGMMDTVLNVGLNWETIQGLSKLHGEVFALDSYRRFLMMYGGVAWQIQRSAFEDRRQALLGPKQIDQMSAQELKSLCKEYRRMTLVLDDPYEQLYHVIGSVFDSWMNERAKLYRVTHNIPQWLGTAVNIQSMVYGNSGNDSGAGVVFSRNITTGAPELYGEFIVNAQGEDVVDGTHTPMPISMLEKWNPLVYVQLKSWAKKLEEHFGDVVDIEFTVEKGKLFLLQSRIAKRTAEAAATIAIHQVWEGAKTKQDAISQLSGGQKLNLFTRSFSNDFVDNFPEHKIMKGLAVSPGAVVGHAVFSTEKAVKHASGGKKVILIRPDTSPDDLEGMMAASAVVTAKGGTTSHAALVARDLQKPAVVGVEFSFIQNDYSIRFSNGTVLREFDEISVDGGRGIVLLGEAEVDKAPEKKEINILLRWIAQAAGIHAKPELSFHWLDSRISANTLVNDFYLSEAMSNAAQGTPLAVEADVLKRAVHKEIADRLATYLVVAVAGEIGHARRFIKFNSSCKCDECQAAKKANKEWDSKVSLLEKKYDIVNRNEFDRNASQIRAATRLKTFSNDDHVEFLSIASSLFEGLTWKSSYGGKKWATFSDAASDFLTGRLTNSVFVDHVFDLEHNGGMLFNKNPMISEEREDLKLQLEMKKHARSIHELYGELRIIHNHFSDPVIDLWRRGEKTGVWQKTMKKAV